MKGLSTYKYAFMLILLVFTACAGESPPSPTKPPASPTNQPTAEVGLSFKPDFQTFDTSSELSVSAGALSPVPNTPDQIRQISYSRLGSIAAWAGDDGNITLFRYNYLEEKYEEIVGITGLPPIDTLVISPDERLVAVGTADSKITVWELEKKYPDECGFESCIRDEPLLVQTIETSAPLGLGFSYDGRMLLSLSNSELDFWDWESGLLLNSSTGEYSALAVSQSKYGPFYAVGYQDGTVKIWDIDSQTALLSTQAHQGRVTSLAFMYDGGVLASGGEDGVIKLWSYFEGEFEEWHTLEKHTEKIRGLVFHPYSIVLASLADDQILFWDVNEGVPIFGSSGDFEQVNVMDFSYYEPELALGLFKGGLETWNVTINDPYYISLTEEAGAVAAEVPEEVTPASSTTEFTTPSPTSPPVGYWDSLGIPMVRVPAGTYSIGGDPEEAYQICLMFRDECQKAWFMDEAPIHQVELNEYLIDQYEVTNFWYSLCVDAGRCEPPALSSSATRDSYYGNPEYDYYPVIYVSWQDATTFCDWRGARLPTEAEWETAARGALPGMIYPWGTEMPFCEFDNIDGAKFDDGMKCNDTDTEAVGSYFPNPLYIFDMAGNVLEWTADWYDVYPGGDPDLFPEYGKTHRVARGGSWWTYGDTMRVSIRFAVVPTAEFDHYGFRCALTP